MEQSFPLRLAILTAIFILTNLYHVCGQSLSSPTASKSEQTAYPVFQGQDNIYYFCGTIGQQNGSLRAVSSGLTVSFLWEKFDSTTGNFSYLSNDTGISSSINALANGCYRVSFRDNGVDYLFRAWIMNSWIEPTATITDSNCDFLKMHGTVTGPDFVYYDLSNRQTISLSPSYKYVWYGSDNLPFSAIQDPTIVGPPTKNTDYRLDITNRGGCKISTRVTYQSIVTKAKFSWMTTQKDDPGFSNFQAPLEVTFTNQSENGDSGKFEWFLFKDKTKIEEESKGGAVQVDSIMEHSYLDNPVYTYEYSGKYMVKLVSSKVSSGYTCRDTFYLEKFIVVDTSLVKVAPAFSPNGDGINDVLIIKTRSLESLDFHVFNRWGGTVHHYSKTGFIPDDAELAVWDGKVGGKLASPGTYFYVVDAVGRDGQRRRKKGFTMMFW